jgi:hypothetical protein
LSVDTTAVQAVLNALVTNLAGAVSGLTVLDEWPDANRKLAYPSLTIFQGAVQFMNLQPELLAKTDPDPTTHETIATYIVGEYDVKFQLDLWAATKVARDKTLKLVLDALNPDPESPGLRLQLAAYYNTWANFTTDGQNIVDDEAASQRREWRAKLTLLANFRLVREKTQYAMITIENNLDASDTIQI